MQKRLSDQPLELQVEQVQSFVNKDAQVVILEGPTRADGLVWWRVDSRKGLVGWSAEGVGDAKYLAPVGWAR